MKTAITLLLLVSAAYADPPTRAELEGIIDGFDSRVGELTPSEIKTAIEAKSAELRAAVSGLPDDEHPHEWETVELPGEGRKIVTHLGLIPDLSADVTHTLQTGPWPTDLPDDARVLIPHGTAVTVESVSDTCIKSIAVQGKLGFSRTQDTRLCVGTILVYPGSEYDQGTEADPITAKSEIVWHGQLDTAFDPEQITVGLVAFGGHVDACGDFVSGTPWTHLTAAAPAGASTIHVSQSVGWKAGDELLVAESTRVTDNSPWRGEYVTISGIAGNAVTVTPALKFPHDGRVAHLTRNVVWRNGEGSAPGHSIIMAEAHGHICCVDCRAMGRTLTSLLDDTLRNPDRSVLHVGTNQRGRYPLHAHHPTHAFVFEDCVIRGSPKWGATHHNAHGIISGLVVLDCKGAGIVGEAGTETGLHIGNYVSRDRKAGSLNVSPDYTVAGRRDALGRLIDDRGFGGYGYWYRGPFIEVVDCAADGHYIEAFSWNVEPLGTTDTVTLSDIEGRPPELLGMPIKLSETGLRRFSDCRTWCRGRSVGLWGFNHASWTLNRCNFFQQNHFTPQCVVFAHTNFGTLTLKDCRIESDPLSKDAWGVGGTYGIDRLILERTTINGFGAGPVQTSEVAEVITVE